MLKMLVLIISGCFFSVFGHEHHHHFYLPEVSEHKAKSFLHKRQATPNPRYCTEIRYESWCESNIRYCQGQHEYTREQMCATSAPCVPGQHCLLTTPCPAHFTYACVDINECASNPCQNGGTCHNGNNLYTCTCLPGWTGHDCEIDIDECASSPCMYGNDCIEDRINSFVCVCSERYEGVHCERDCRPGPADIMFLLDTSLSQLEVMNRSIEYMTRFVKQIPIGPNDFQVALVSYAFKPELVFNFTAHQSNTSVLDALSLIKSESGPTTTSDALTFVAQEILKPENGARLLPNISHYAVIVTNGLSTDRNQAIQTAQFLKATDSRFKILAVGVGDDIGHEELIQLPTDPSYTFAPDNDDLLMAMLKDAADYGCTDCNSSSVTDVVILFDTSKTTSPLTGNSIHSLKVVDKLFDSFDVTNTDIRAAMMTYGNGSQIKFNFHQRSIHDTKAKIYTASIEDEKGNTSLALSSVQDKLFFGVSTGSRFAARKIVYLFSNGKWTMNEISEIKQEILKLHDAGISVNIMIPIRSLNAEMDNILTNASNVAFDPFRVYLIEDNASSVSFALNAAVRDTKYVECPPDIFKAKQ
ncbi:von Willebrand factor A domain-containing protein 2-like [Ostrea edulis]|uniref:von Willebrand factor A domain-containing protein 2-like n=1 Tax=Ostrea edulis TaxID=37623 RepID=UPI002095D37E|nr:von Willebrand factor A domain-containing protein 2-like [Ostrea edulis]